MRISRERERSRRISARRFRLSASAGLLFVFLVPPACSDSTGPKRTPTTLRLSQTEVRLDDAGSVQLTATVLDQKGEPFETPPAGFEVRWSSSDDAIASVIGGTVTGNFPGDAEISAAAGELRESAAVTVTPVAAALEPDMGDDQQGIAGRVLADSLAVRVTDRHGNGVAGVEVRFVATSNGGSLSPASLTTGVEGYARAEWILGVNAGENRAEARVAGLSGSPVVFRATGAEGTDPFITGISPETLVPGEPATITGTNFSVGATGNIVTIGGVAATVTAVTETQLSIRVPPRGALACEPTGDVDVAVTIAGRSGTRRHPLTVAIQRSLAIGESVSVLDAAEVRCNELAENGGRYVISVFNTSTTVGALTSFQLRGASAAAPAAAPLRVTRAPTRAAPADRVLPGLSRDERRAAAAHARILERNRRLVQRLGIPRPGGGRRAAFSPSLQSIAPPMVGDELTLRIPDIDADNSCLSYHTVGTRTVYSGSRAVILEDTAAPLAGTMDDLFAQVGREFDDVMFEVLAENFGNPLAFDASTDDNGRILMLFSEVVNDFGGVAGFVFGGDFYPRAECASSGQAEIFYAMVPTSSGSGFDSGTRDQWLRTIRSTIIHEVKHITSFAERFARNASVFEENWLEESTARISEELWAREIFGYGQKGNVGYAASIYCEVRPSWPECTGRPIAMLKHFSALYDYYESIETLTPVGRVEDGDFTFYGSGWSLVRWALDHSSMPEAAFLQALTQETARSGVRNLEARTGRSFAAMLGDWSLAAAIDDSGVDPARAELTLPGWNTRDVFAGLNGDFADSYPQAFPLATRSVSYGAFTVDVTALRAGSAAIFELGGGQAGTQLIEVRGLGGGDPAPTLRIAIVRVQ